MQQNLQHREKKTIRQKFRQHRFSSSSAVSLPVSPNTAERITAPLSVPNSEQEDDSCIFTGPLLLHDESKVDVVLPLDFTLSVSALLRMPPFSISL